MREFVQKNKRAIVLSLIFTFVCFGFMLTNFELSIDEETWILSQKQSLLWLQQGRFGIWLFDLIFTTGGNYAPFLWDVLAIILWYVSGIIFFYTLLSKKEIKEWIFGLSMAMYTSLPFVVGESLGFSMYSVQVCLAMVAVAGGFYCTEKYSIEHSKKNLVLAVIMLVWAFSVYQALVGVYITIVVAKYMLMTSDGEKFTKQSRKDLLLHVIMCCGSTVIYFLINKVVFLIVGDPGYLSNGYIGWKNPGCMLLFVKVVANMGRILLAIPYKGNYIYGGVVIRVVVIIFAIYAIALFFRKKGWKNKLQVFVFSVALCIAPFMVYILLNTINVFGRMLLGLPITLAVAVYIVLSQVSKAKKMKVVVTIMVCYLLFLNACNMNLIYFYDSIVYTRDCAIADQIMNRIEKETVDYSEKPIAFIGMIEQDDLPIQKSATLGGSFFEWDEGNETRIRDFLLTRGYKIEIASGVALQKALQQADQMNTWPKEGSVCELDDVIVVYLSEPTEAWYNVNGINNLK